MDFPVIQKVIRIFIAIIIALTFYLPVLYSQVKSNERGKIPGTLFDLAATVGIGMIFVNIDI
jgi:hypothetical protein